MKLVLDTAKVGTKGYPRHWQDLGFSPPLIEVTDDDPRDAYVASQGVVSYQPPTPAEKTLAGGSAPTADDVDRERDRRILLVEFGGHLYDGDELSLARIDRAKSNALAAIVNGVQPGNLRWADAEHDFGWITSNSDRNQFVTMDAETCLAFGLAAASWEGRHIIAARALKNMSPIPADYATNPAYWPQAE